MENEKIKSIIENITDLYGDFYITKQRIRYAINENVDLLFKCIEKGDKLFVVENGVAVVVGYSDSAPRKYVKILTTNNGVAETLLKRINKEIPEELYAKIKNENPCKKVFEKCGYIFAGGRGREVLLVRKIEGNK